MTGTSASSASGRSVSFDPIAVLQRDYKTLTWRYLCPRFPYEIECEYRRHKSEGASKVALAVAISMSLVAIVFFIVVHLTAIMRYAEVDRQSGSPSLLIIDVYRSAFYDGLIAVYAWAVYSLHRLAPSWMGRNADRIYFVFGVYIVIFCSCSADMWLALIDPNASHDELLCRALAFDSDRRAGVCAIAANVTACCADPCHRPCIQREDEYLPMFILVTTFLYLGLCCRIPNDAFLGLSGFAGLVYTATQGVHELALSGPTNIIGKDVNFIQQSGALFFNLALVFFAVHHIDHGLRRDFAESRDQRQKLEMTRKRLREVERVNSAYDEINRLSTSESPNIASPLPASGLEVSVAAVPAEPLFSFEAADDDALDRSGWLPPVLALPPAETSSGAATASARPGDPLRRLLTSIDKDAYSQVAAEARQLALLDVASKLRERSYTLHGFLNEVIRCLPELALYMTVPAAAAAGAAGAGVTSSGRTTVAEYLRTLGALTAVFWLSRLDLEGVVGSDGLDGQRGFCFGVEESSWRPPSRAMLQRLSGRSEADRAKLGEGDRKRLAFVDEMEWAALHALMCDAGLLRAGMLKSNGGVSTIVHPVPTLAAVACVRRPSHCGVTVACALLACGAGEQGRGARGHGAHGGNACPHRNPRYHEGAPSPQISAFHGLLKP